jgi:membrane protease YdiL (CAAX protease family)
LPALESGLQAGYSQSALIVTWALVAILGVLAGPIVEELYFRGFLSFQFLGFQAGFLSMRAFHFLQSQLLLIA